MAHTYYKIPDSLSPVLKQLVKDTSDALLEEIGFPIFYKADSFMRIMSELSEEVKSKPIRYPLIALIQPYPSKFGNYSHQEIECDIVICTLTKAEYSWEQREDATFNPILLPIYAEFIERFKAHNLISYNGVNPAHTLLKLYHLGDTQGNKNGYIVPDTVDAVFIEGLKFNLEKDTMSCVVDYCEPIHEIALIDYISSYSVSGVGSTSLVVGISSAVFISLLPGGPIEYTINYGVGAGDVPISVLTPLTFSIVGIATGTYIGVITSSYGSQVEFEYTVVGNGQNISSIVYMPSIGVDYGELNCLDNGNYPIDITFRGLSSSQLLDSAKIVTSDGTVIYNEYIAALDATRTYNDYRLTTLSESFDIQLKSRLHNILNNKINLQIKTI